MKNSQINFYLTKQDISELENYLHENEFRIISDILQNGKILKVDTLDYPNTSKKIIYHPDDESNLVIAKTKSGISIINETLSPVIEYWNPTKWEDTHIMPRGRLYYTTHFYNFQNQRVSKSEAFLKLADDLFKWIKKNFKNVKLSGYEAFLISERTQAWMQATGGKLADMVRGEEFRKKKSAVAV